MIKEWVSKEGDSYLVTGVDVRGRRFKRVCQNWVICSSVNVYRGTRWLVRDGKRIKLQEVYN